MRHLNILIVIYLLIGINAHSSAADSWQKELKGEFDIVDTFDNYENWRGDVFMKCEYQSDNIDNLPKYKDGSAGLWGKYCYRRGYEGGVPPMAVADHGADKIVTGKSVRLSFGGQGLYKGELSEFTMFFGELGDEFSGYDEVYIFFRMYLPHNAFPTYNASGTDVCYEQKEPPVVCHIQGNDYYGIASWKWFAFETGWRSDKCFSNFETCPPEAVDHACRYGDSENHLHIKTNGTLDFKQTFRLANRGAQTSYPAHWGIPGAIRFDKLIGIEFHLKLESAIGADDGIFKAWVYDENGKAELSIGANNVSYRPGPSGNTGGPSCYQQSRTEKHKFNRIMIESNKHVTGQVFNCGTGMDCAWYMDDFIINKSRIGPKYYELLKPDKPSMLRINQ